MRTLSLLLSLLFLLLRCAKGFQEHPLLTLPRGGGSTTRNNKRWGRINNNNNNNNNNNRRRRNPGQPPSYTTESTSNSPTTTSSLDASSSSSSSSSSTPLDYNATALDAASVPLTDLLQMLQVQPNRGLSPRQVQERLRQFGPNQLPTPAGKSLWKLIQEQFDDKLVQILLGVAFLSAVFSVLEVKEHLASAAAAAATATVSSAETLGDVLSSSSEAAAATATTALWKSFVEPLVIVAILLGNAIVGIWQSQSAQDSLQALQKMQPQLATAVRQTISSTPQNDSAETGTNGDNESSSTAATLAAAELVPGDILQIRVGDKIPADARVLSLDTAVLAVDEGSLTGESTTVQKIAGHVTAPDSPIQDQANMLFAGTVVTRGAATAVVVQTATATQFGRIQQGVMQASDETPKTPLGRKLDAFGEQLTAIIAVICFAVWIVSIPKMNDPTFGGNWVQGAVYYAKVAVALGVAAIPEGLPAVITLCLSLGTRRMAQRNVVVRQLPSVETLGCTSVICTDKTGTLTTNEMTVVSLVVMEKSKQERVHELQVQGVSYSPLGDIETVPLNTEVQEKPNGAMAYIAAVSALCNDAKVVGNDHVAAKESKKSSKKRTKKTDTEASAKAYERMGEPTEAALCVLAEKLGGLSHYLEHLSDAADNSNRRGGDGSLHLDVLPSTLASANVDAWRELYPRQATLEFSRDRKSMSVLCRRGEKANNRLYVKGAPNLLLERCTKIKYRDGTVSRLTGDLRRELEAKISEMAARPLRCLALAVKEDGSLESSLRKYTKQEDNSDENDASDNDPTSDTSQAPHPLLSKPEKYRDIESGLTLVGIVGIKDPARPEVADSIQECTRAGIRVMMITGDARDTAVAIAKDVNIFKPDQTDIKAFEGREFFALPQKKQLEILKEDNIVFCRAEPADKQKLVHMLQTDLNEITAMTGDGVNDAPALQQASIGLAMGITGTEVAKEAADMILVDDNFSTIVSAVEEGRRIYANMQAFICFLISCNIGEICAIFFATLAGFPEPLTAMHLLWVNLVTDGPPATALGFNPPSPDLMDDPPRPSDEPIMTNWLLTRYCLTGLYVGFATIGVFAQHYLDQGITLSQLSSWSQCGEFWSPPEGAATCSELFQGAGRMLPQTLALTTLVCMEMLKALSAVSVDNSLLQVGPQSNPWLLLGVSVPFLLHLFVVYSQTLGIPALAESFGMVPLSVDNWYAVLSWAVPILLVDEILKAIGRWIHHEDKQKAKQKPAAITN